MSKRRKVSKTGIVLVICMLICLLLALAVVPGGFGSDNKKDLDDIPETVKNDIEFVLIRKIEDAVKEAVI